MEEELILKQKYNDLLKSLEKGKEFVEKNPNDEKAQKRLDEIIVEMQNIMNAIPNMTANEMENGFLIQENKKVEKEPKIIVHHLVGEEDRLPNKLTLAQR